MSVIQGHAQLYKTAVGLHVDAANGSMIGVQGKHFVTDKHAVAAQVIFASGGTLIGAEYTFNQPFKMVDNFNWYVGAGADIYFFDQNTNFGLRPILGLEYKLTNAPIAFSLDWRSRFAIDDKLDYFAGVFGIGIKYTF